MILKFYLSYYSLGTDLECPISFDATTCTISNTTVTVVPVIGAFTKEVVATTPTPVPISSGSSVSSGVSSGSPVSTGGSPSTTTVDFSSLRGSTGDPVTSRPVYSYSHSPLVRPSSDAAVLAMSVLGFIAAIFAAFF